jgi:hypothetical protein
MNSMKLKKLFTAMDWVLLHQKNGIPLHPSGEVSEWLKEHAWKVCIRQKCIEGSNPSLSAKAIKKLAERLAFLLLERWESSL